VALAFPDGGDRPDLIVITPAVQAALQSTTATTRARISEMISRAVPPLPQSQALNEAITQAIRANMPQIDALSARIARLVGELPEVDAAVKAARIAIEVGGLRAAVDAAARAAATVAYRSERTGVVGAPVGELSAELKAQLFDDAELIANLAKRKGTTEHELTGAIRWLGDQISQLNDQVAQSNGSSSKTDRILVLLSIFVAILALARDVADDGWTGDSPAPPSVTVVVSGDTSGKIDETADFIEQVEKIVDKRLHEQSEGVAGNDPGEQATGAT